MKIYFNQTTQINNHTYTPQGKKTNSFSGKVDNNSSSLPGSELSLANFPNVSFRGRKIDVDAKFLLSQSAWLRCAYSNTKMIHPEVAKNIFQKLEKRPNAQSAVNFLQQYQKLMHETESRIFDLFVDAPRKGKRDFQDILHEYLPEALERLKAKQYEILYSTDKLIDKLSPKVREKALETRDIIIGTIENGPFRRQTALDMIKNIKAEGQDAKHLQRIYKIWYTLPKSRTDVDAYIVKYASQPHSLIAKNLLRTAVATIEHIKPDSKNGADDLENYLLVSAGFNSDRNNMPLSEYISLNQSKVDIKGNLQNYIDNVIKEIHKPKSEFSDKSWYPLAIQNAVLNQTQGQFKLNVSNLRLTSSQKKEKEYAQKLSEVYKVLAK